MAATLGQAFRAGFGGPTIGEQQAQQQQLDMGAMKMESLKINQKAADLRLQDAIGLQDEGRLNALATDIRASRILAEQGNIDSAMKRLTNRSAEIKRMGGDSTHTDSIIDLWKSGDQEGAIEALATADMSMFAAGRSKPMGQAQLKVMQQMSGPAKRETKVVDKTLFERDDKGDWVKVAGGEGGVKPADLQKQVNTLRASIKDSNKDFAKIEAARNRITKTGRNATAASDISLIFNFMKMNDPGSTVREGEFATAQNATGVDGKLVNIYNQAIEGTRLSAAQREDFIGQSEGLFEAQRDALDSQIENTLQQADQDAIPRVRVFGKERLKAFEERRALRPEGEADAVQLSDADLLSKYGG